MTDLPHLDTVHGEELTPSQIHGILNQIDLDITNLVREGKLSALKYSVAGGVGTTTDRAANLNALLLAREHYQKLLCARPSWSTSQVRMD